jgi:hypothetical protein
MSDEGRPTRRAEPSTPYRNAKSGMSCIRVAPARVYRRHERRHGMNASLPLHTVQAIGFGDVAWAARVQALEPPESVLGIFDTEAAGRARAS